MIRLFIICWFVGSAFCSNLLANTENLACTAPVLANVIEVTASTALLDWVPGGDNDTWEVAVLPADAPPPVAPTHTTAVVPFNAGGLLPGTVYTFYVRAVCGIENSSWTAFSSTFITDLTNPSDCLMQLDIPDPGCLDIGVEVSGVGGNTLGDDVILSEVLIIISHEWNDDVDLALENPNGTTVILSADNGGSDDNYGDPDDVTCMSYTAFVSDQVENNCGISSIETASPPYIGSFLPENSLANFNDLSDPNGTWTLSVCDDVGTDVGTLEFVELVFETVICPAPSTVLITDIDSTSISLDWLPGTDCLNTVIEYGPPGFIPGTAGSAGGGILILAGCPPYVLTGLSPDTDYDIYIRENCIATYSPNSCVVIGLTDCSPPTATYTEDVDGVDICTGTCTSTCGLSGGTWINSQADDRDWQVNSGPTPTTTTGPTDDISGGGRYFYMEASGGCMVGGQAELYSSCLFINASPSSSCHFSFYYHMFGSGINTLLLEISADGWVTSDTLFELSGDQGNAWHQQFIDLSFYDGQEAQMRFVGLDGDNARADIALDELTFYGSTNEGLPPNIYYEDIDGDGYGNVDVFLALCSATSPPGYVDQGGDCNDLEALIYPNQPESPCDGIDINCNGDADEFILPPPVVSNDTICNGGLALIEAIPGYFGEIYWYDTSVGGVALDTTTGYVPIPPPTLSSNMPEAFTYYAEEENFLGCISDERAEAIIYVLPEPEILILDDQFPPSCAGTTIDLSQWVIQDLNNTGISVTYHSSLPANGGNEINPPFVNPLTNTYFYVRAESAEGCSAIDSILVEMAPGPIPEIIGSTEICLLEDGLLQVIDNGNGAPPLQYLWSTGSTLSSITVNGIGPVGSTQIYSVTVTADNGCSKSDTATVETISSFDGIGVSVDDVTSCGGTDGGININPIGGQAPYTIIWDGTQSGSVNGQNGMYTIELLAQGAYNVTVTDSSPNACPFVLPNLIVDGPLASVSLVSVTPAGCYGDSEGCIEIDVSGVDPQILWSTSDTTEEVCGLSAGFYSVTVTDGACVSEILDIEVVEADSLFGKVSVINDVSCNGFSDGDVFLIVAGGTSPFSYEWSNLTYDPQLLDVPAGDYFVTVTDALGCTWEGGPFEVTEPDPLVFESDILHVDCAGAVNGRIEVNVTGGTQPYTYFWNNGGNAPFIDFLEPGIYDLTVIDFRGCTFSESYEITEPSPLEITAIEYYDASCFGLEDGILSVTMEGGTLPYSFAWSNGDTLSMADSLSVGYYSVIITDGNGCLVEEDSLEISAPVAVEVSFEFDNAVCVGVDNAEIEVSVISGTPPLEFNWSNGDTGVLADSLAPGPYTLTVTNGVGCVDTFQVEVGANQPLIPTISTLDPNCYNGDNGAIFLTVLGGDPQYSYEWSTGQETADIEDLSAGGYVVTVIDEDDCVLVSDSIFLNNPPEILIDIVAIDSILCADDFSGAIYVEVTGGIGAFEYNWSNEAMTEDILNLPGGTYSLTVVDELNCSHSSGPITLNIPALLEVEVENLNGQIDCSGNTIDTVYLNVMGGTPEYTFAWSDSTFLPYLTDMDPGEYAVTITDANGCEFIERPIKVPEPIIPLQMTQNLELLSVVDCNYSGGNSQLQILIEGDGPPYQYNWSFGLSGPVQSDTLNAPPLMPGYYSLTVTDGNGCVAEEDSLLVVAFTALTLNVLPNNINDVNCFGGSDGWIDLMAAGGVPPYVFIWTNMAGDTVSYDEDPIELSAGIYAVEMIDFNGCSITLEGLNVGQPEAPLSLEYSVINNFCYGYSEGSININVLGGTSPYDYIWNTGDEDEDLSGLPADYYSVTVQDVNDCILEFDSIYVSEPLDSIQIDSVILTHVSCFGELDGAIDLEMPGSPDDYSFFWSNDKFTEDISDLAAGFYYCLIVDITGCQRMTDTFEITQPPALVLDMTSTPQTQGDQDGTATSEISGGVPPYMYEWNTMDTTYTIDSLFSGNYQLLVTDSAGCTIDGVIFVDLQDTIVGTVELLQIIEYQLYPNPANDILYLEINLPETHLCQWELLDVYGRSLQKGSAIRTEVLFESIAVGSLPDAAYFIRIIIGDVGSVLLPFVKG